MRLNEEHLPLSAYVIRDACYTWYDGGWRAKDRKQLIEEFDLTEDEAELACDFLEQIEKDDIAM